MTSWTAIFFVFVNLLSREILAQPSWLLRQQIHSMGFMSSAEEEKICRLNDARRAHDLLSPMKKVRVSGTRESRRVASFIKNELREAGFHVEFHEFHDQTPEDIRRGNTRLFKNIIATWDINAPRRLLLACHYDSKQFKDSIFIGAIDSAFPCSVLMDTGITLAPMLSRRGYFNPNAPDSNKEVTLQLVFFDGEEAFEHWTATDSLYGSRALARKWESEHFSGDPTVKEIQRMDVMVLLDLLGSPQPQIVNFDMGASRFYQGLQEIEENLLRTGCMKARSPFFMKDRSFPGSHVEDDHKPFYEKGSKIVHLIPVPFPPAWHQSSKSRNPDDWTALDDNAMHNWLAIIRVFAAKYLRLQ